MAKHRLLTGAAPKRIGSLDLHLATNRRDVVLLRVLVGLPSPTPRPRSV